MPEANLNVKLLRYTAEPELTAATAASMCYNKSEVKDLLGKMSKEKAEKLIAHILKLGHYSVLEHANFTFAIEGISRACSHQLVRHRIASYSQQSQRYVDVGEDYSYIIPPTIKEDKEAMKKFEEVIKKTQEVYAELGKKVPKEDARFVLPNACETKIIMTMNTRSLYNFFEKRTCTRAQWEIRALANKMLEEVQKVAPLLFSKAGPSCKIIGICKEGKMSCGLWKTIPGAVLRE